MHSKFSEFDNYNDLPTDRLGLLLDPRIVKMDEMGVLNIEKKIEAEREEEEMKTQ